MSAKSESGKIVSLQEVKEFLGTHEILEVEIPRDRVDELYYLIDDHGYGYVRDPETKCYMCSDDEAYRIATIELLGILELDNSVVNEHLTIVDGYISKVCKRFSDLRKKDKIAFYIVVLDKLL